MTELSKYRTIIFDCDGVVLDSNRIKTKAFESAALPWGRPAAKELVAHHVANGGISRYAKFAHFLDVILPQHAPGGVPGQDGPDLDALLDSYAQSARAGLLSCSAADGLEELRAATPHASWMVVSGGDQAELRHVFRQRRLDHLFDGGIFGSPDPKSHILDREIKRGAIEFPALFLGDSRLDHEAASEHELDFMFVSEWTDFKGWKDYAEGHGLNVIPTISALMKEAPVCTNRN